MENETFFVIIHPDDGIMGIDYQSGGYPWFPKTIREAAKFLTVEKANEYIASFKSYDRMKGCFVCKATISYSKV